MTDFRDAVPADAAMLSALARQSFTETFGHLYDPADLAAFLDRHTPAAWAEEIADPAYAIRIAEQAGTPVGYAKLGPPTLPFEPRGAAIELRQFYLLGPAQGTGAAQAMMAWVIDTARDRGRQTSICRSSSTTIARVVSTNATASYGSANMASWSAIIAIPTMS